MTSSSLVSSPLSWRYGVFLSYHGADVPKDFVNCIMNDVTCKGINTFIDDDIDRSNSMGSKLIKAIRGSRITVVILSMNYVSSPWCLDKLVEIIKCRDELRQEVVPVFYNRCDIEKHTGEFGKLFIKTADDIGRWRHALEEVAKIGGYSSHNWHNEAATIKNVVDDISNILKNSTTSSDIKGLTAVESHLEKIEPLLGPKARDLDDKDLYIGENFIYRGVSNESQPCVYINPPYAFRSSYGMDVWQKDIVTFVDCNGTPDVIKKASPSVEVSFKNYMVLDDEDLYTCERSFGGVSNESLHRVYIDCTYTLQHSFASHLSMDFRQKGIYAFVNCNGTPDMIEGASAYVVVFSENYLSSTSCLEKLVRVLQRKRTGQLVIPVFYRISPSDMVVLVQQHESDQIREWSSALQQLKELPGHHYREDCSEYELVEEIVKDVCERLFPTKQIGINTRLMEIEQLICKQAWGIRRLGIWGMPGIGKTTLAKAVFNQISGAYEVSCFIDHFDKAFHDKGLHQLLEEHFGKVLRKLPLVCSSITRPSIPRENFFKKRTLVILDGVHNPLVAESFLKGFHWFGPGSLIIITSRDKQVFRVCQISHVYEVQSLNRNEALQLFSQCAFGKDRREQNLTKLSKEVIDYASGNPLAITFYGKELKGKRLSEMETIFLKLKLRAPYKIHDLFKSSYETLNNCEKNIFLDIACFFQGEMMVDHVMPLLEGCGLFPHVAFDVLVEKCLVTISGNRVKMHRIIQDFGREIINRETVQIERRRRLWEPWTIKFLLENKDPDATYKRALGSEDIEAISLDTSNLPFDVKPTAFEDMISLRFLQIFCSDYENGYGVGLPHGLESLPNDLRLLHWDHYPLPSLPQDFDPIHLVKLDMSFSKLQNLWGGTKNLDKLKVVRLCSSQQLNEIDDICKAQNIESINLRGCTKLKRFPATGLLQHLRVVDLSGCREINCFPEVSPNIEELYLEGTGIKELSVSIGNATKLKMLDLSNCSSLLDLPSSLGNVTNLEILNLSNCSSLLKLPSSFENVKNLKECYLHGCSSLVEFPALLGNVIHLKILDLSNCLSLVKLPSSIEKAINLQELNIEYCSSLVELPSLFGNAGNLMNLYVTGCSKLVKLPSSIRNSTNLISFDLEGDNNQPIVTVSDNSRYRCIEVRHANRGKFFLLKGEQQDEHYVSLNLRMVDENEVARNNRFMFYQEDDTTSEVSSELVEKLGLTDEYITFIAELIDILLVNMIPNWETDVAVDHLNGSQLNQNEDKPQGQEETAIHDVCKPVSHPWTSNFPRSGEEDEQCVDVIKVDGSSNQEVEEATEPVSLEEEERLRQELEDIEAKYEEEMQEIARKREEAIMEAKKKLSLMKKRTT